MSKILKFIIVLLFMSLVFFVFPKNIGEKKEKTHEDVISMTTYIKKVSRMNQERNDIVKEYEDNVIGKKDKMKIYSYLEKNIIPKQKQFEKEVSKQKFENKDASKLHAMYLKGVRLQSSSYDLYLRAFKDQKEDMYKEAIELSKKADKELIEHSKAVIESAEEYKIKMPQDAK